MQVKVWACQQGKVMETKTSILLFARLRMDTRLPFVYLGRLHRPQVDWEAGSCGIFHWELQV